MARVTAGSRQRTLTSSNTYNTGSLHTATLTLEGTRLFLTTKREVVTKRLRLVPVDSLLPYTELFVGGAGLRLQEEQGVDHRNFSGCIRVQSSAAVTGPPEAPKCIGRATEVTACIYCSTHEVCQPMDRIVNVFFTVHLMGDCELFVLFPMSISLCTHSLCSLPLSMVPAMWCSHLLLHQSTWTSHSISKPILRMASLCLLGVPAMYVNIH